MKQLYTIISLLFLFTYPAWAQQHEIFNQRIRTLQVVGGTNWLSLPVSSLGGEPIHIDFDDMTHDYHRYSYKIEHCDANWNVSASLFESDYMRGFNGNQIIEDVEQSINTNHPYTHYHLAIPNADCQLTMSGNYRLTVYDDNAENEEEGKMFTACWMITEPQPLVKLKIEATSTTDIDIQKDHQQLKMELDHSQLRITHPNQLNIVVLQNGRWDNAVINPKPDYLSAGKMSWQHVRALIFDAGNEYRKFEFLDTDHPSMGIDAINWDGSDYQVKVMTDSPRPNYVYDEAAKGSFYIRNSDNVENNNTCEYAQIHFTLKAPKLPGDVYLNADWTYDRFLPEYRMEYDEMTKTYHARLFMKQGYYSYQYLMKMEDGSIRLLPSEGNFYQTQNKYNVLVYYRAPSDRTDRLVGYGELK